MTAENQTRQTAPAEQAAQGMRGRARRIAAIGLLRVRPYARYRARQIAVAGTLTRLEADFEHVRERHTEQIERLEDLTRELVLAVESLRRDLATRGRRDEG